MKSISVLLSPKSTIQTHPECITVMNPMYHTDSKFVLDRVVAETKDKPVRVYKHIVEDVRSETRDTIVEVFSSIYGKKIPTPSFEYDSELWLHIYYEDLA